jgi:hypothetical protein
VGGVDLPPSWATNRHRCGLGCTDRCQNGCVDLDPPGVKRTHWGSSTERSSAVTPPRMQFASTLERRCAPDLSTPETGLRHRDASSRHGGGPAGVREVDGRAHRPHCCSDDSLERKSDDTLGQLASMDRGVEHRPREPRARLASGVAASSCRRQPWCVAIAYTEPVGLRAEILWRRRPARTAAPIRLRLLR